VDWEIERHCCNPEIKLIEPYKAEMLNPNSVDLIIGKFLLKENSPKAILDGEEEWIKVDLLQYSKEVPFMVFPGQFILTETEETFNVPNFLCGEFRLKSSRAREGWDHATSIWIDSVYHGSKLTLELRNNRQSVSLPIYSGLRIGQAIFHSCAVPRKSYRETGRYNNNKTVMSSKG
jgi:dCTP deaminase